MKFGAVSDDVPLPIAETRTAVRENVENIFDVLRYETKRREPLI